MKNTCFALLAVIGAGSACGQPPGERVVVFNGVEIAYTVMGEGEPVLLIPAAIGDSFLPMMSEPALEDYQLIAFHQPGEGHSGDYDGPTDPGSLADFGAELIRYLGIGEAHIVGHSAGAAVAVGLAMTNPELVHSLVLLEAGPVQYDGFDAGPLFTEHRDEFSEPAEWMLWTEPRSHEEAVDAFMTWLANDPNWVGLLSPSIPDIQEQAMRIPVPTPQARAAAQRDSLTAPVVLKKSDFDKVTQPTLWVWSDERLGVSVIAYHQLSELIPQMETEYVSGMRHGLQLVAPGPVAEVIAGFIQRHPIN